MKKQPQIWKFKVKNGIISMPEGSKILSLQTQRNEPFMWALVDPEAFKVDRYFEIFGTGHDLHSTKCHREYVGTYQINAGDEVYHVFELL